MGGGIKNDFFFFNSYTLAYTKKPLDIASNLQQLKNILKKSKKRKKNSKSSYERDTQTKKKLAQESQKWSQNGTPKQVKNVKSSAKSVIL